MQKIQYTTVDKSKWPPGPWHDEPDKLQWMDAATRMPCLIVRGPSGALCGYVGVAEGQQYFGVEYDAVHAEVHGGLTFAGFCQAGHESEGVCHVPDDGEPEHVYWLGFDCAHAGDVSPGYLHILGRSRDLVPCPWTDSGY